MICEFCNEEFTGRPVKQGGQVYCSIACADAAADIGKDYEDDGYYEEDDLELDSYRDDEDY